MLAALLPSCSKTSPRISVVCEENNVGNSVVKWETIPEIPGEVKVYASESPEHTGTEHLVASAPISDQHLTIITTDPMRKVCQKAHLLCLAQSPDFHKLGLCYYLKILYL